MRRKLIIDGNAVYEIDDECVRCKEISQKQETLQEKISEIKDCDGRVFFIDDTE